MRRRSATDVEILNVERQIHEAALCPEMWPEVMAAFSDLTLSTISSILVRDVSGRIILAALDPRLPSDVWEVYRESWAERDDLAQAASRLLPDRIGRTEDVLPLERAKRSAAWNDFYLPHGFRHLLATAPRIGSAGALATLVTYRSSCQLDFAPAEIRIVERLLPHFVTAIRTHLALRGAVDARTSLEAAFDALQQAYFLVDRTGRILFQNRAAREILNSGDGFLVQGGRLRCAIPAMTGELDLLVVDTALLLDGACHSRGATLQIPRLSGLPPYLVTAMPIPPQADIRDVPSPSVALRVVRPEATVAGAEKLLLDLYGLTAAEARLAIAICNGQSLQEEAELLRTTVGTLRTRLKVIFAKTGAKRQGELVSLLLRGPLSPST